MSPSLSERLTGGSPRSLGKTNAVVNEVLLNPELLGELVSGLNSPDALVQTRTANALKKIAASRAALLQPFARPIVTAWKSANPGAMRWNLTLVVGKLEFSPRDQAIARNLLLTGLESSSVFQRTFCMQALADLAAHDHTLKDRLLPILEHLTATGSAATQARGRKLLRQLRSTGRDVRAVNLNRAGCVRAARASKSIVPGDGRWT